MSSLNDTLLYLQFEMFLIVTTGIFVLSFNVQLWRIRYICQQKAKSAARGGQETIVCVEDVQQ
jgi:hypothetical protein